MIGLERRYASGNEAGSGNLISSVLWFWIEKKEDLRLLVLRVKFLFESLWWLLRKYRHSSTIMAESGLLHSISFQSVRPLFISLMPTDL